MKNHNRKLIGLLITLALLCASLLGGGALAEDEPRLEGLNIGLSDSQVEPGEELDIRYRPANVEGDDSVDVTHTLNVECVKDGEPVIAAEPIEGGVYVLDTDNLDPGCAYRVRITASAEGYDPVSEERYFLITESSESYSAWLEVDNDNPWTNEKVRIRVHAAGISDAKEVILYQNGMHIESWGGDELDDGEAEFYTDWEKEEQLLLYVRAKFEDRWNPEGVWVTSDARMLDIREEDNAVDLRGGATLTTPIDGQTYTRGELINVNVTPLEGNNDAWIGVTVTSQDDGSTFYGEYDPDGVVIPTVDCTPGNTGKYKVYVWWKSRGQHVEDHGDGHEITIKEPENDIVFGVTGLTDPDHNTTEPLRDYTLYALAPEAERVCIFEDREVRAESGSNSIVFYDASDRREERRYYLGVWDEDTEDWRRLDEQKITVNISYDGDLPEPDLKLYVPGEVEDQPRDVDGVLYENDELHVQVSAMEWLENTPEGFDSKDVYYSVEIRDETDDYRWVWGQDFCVGDEPWDERFVWNDNWFQLGHSYEVSARAYYGNYPVRGAFRRFVVVPPQGQDGQDVTLKIGDAVNNISVNANQEVKIDVAVPEGIAAVQVFWDGEWRGCHREWRDSNWSWTDRLDSTGDQRIVARVTRQNPNEDEWEDWDDEDWSELNWEVYSNVVHVTVNDAGPVALPTFTVDKTVARGENLEITVGKCDGSIRAYQLYIKGRNEWGDYWEHIDDISVECEGDALDQSHTYYIPTMTLEPDTYRLQLRVQANEGWRNNESEYDDEAFYFTVTEPGEDPGFITVTGADVEWDDAYECYTVPTGSDYTISGYLPGAGEICLYEWNWDDEDGQFDEDEDNIRADWGDCDSFTWQNSEGMTEVYEYVLGVWNGEEECWQKLTDEQGNVPESAKLVLKITATDQLDEAVLYAPPVAELNDDMTGTYTFAFKPVDNAQSYRLELRVKDEWKEIYTCDFDPVWNDSENRYDNLPDGVSYKLDENRFVVTVSLPGQDEEYGDVPNGFDERCAVVVNATSPGWGGSWVESEFITVSKPTLTLDLTAVLKPDGEDDNFYVNVPVTFTVSNLQGRPDRLEYYWEGDWWRNSEDFEDFWVNFDDNVLTFKDSVDEPCEGQLVMVRAWYGDHWEYSDSRTLDFNIRGGFKLNPPDVTLEGNDIEQGDRLEINIGQMDAPDNTELSDLVDHYNLEIYDAEGDDMWEERWHDECEPGTTSWSLNTLALNEGDYRLCFEAVLTNQAADAGWYCESIDPDDESLRFTVNGLDSEKMLVSVDGEVLEAQGGVIVVPAGKRFDVEAVRPNWYDGICIFEDEDENPIREYQGGYCCFDDEWHDEETHTYTLGYWERVQEEWLRTKTSVTVKSVYNGDLQAPVIVAPPFVNVNDEASYSFSVSDEAKDADGKIIEYAELWVELWHADGEKPMIDSDSWEQGFEVPADKFEAGEAYSVRAWFHAPGYHDGYSEHCFVAVPNPDGNITLDVKDPNGNPIENNGSVSVQANEEFTIDLTLYGELSGKTAELYWDNNWQESVFPRNERRDAGVYTLVARVQDDGGSWHYSNAIPLTVNSVNGQIGMPQIGLSEMDDDGKLTLTLSGITDLKDSTQDYGITIWDRENNDVMYDIKDGNIDLDDPDVTESDSVEMAIDTREVYSGGDMENPKALGPGFYRVHVHANARTGWSNNWTDGNDESLWFDIDIPFGIKTLNPETEEWSELKDEAEVALSEDFCISAELPMGGNYAVRVNDWDKYRGDWNEHGEIHYAFGEPDPDTYEFTLHRWQDDGWHPVEGKRVTVQIDKSASQQLDDPEITVASTVSLSNPVNFLEFSFKDVIGEGGWYNVNVYNDTQDNTLFDDGVSRYDHSWTEDKKTYNQEEDGDNKGTEITYSTGAYTVRVPLDVDGRAAEGDKLSINVDANRQGWYSSHGRREVLCVGQKAPEIELTVNGRTDNLDDVRSGQGLDFEIKTNGVDNIQFFWDGDWRYFGTGEGNYWPFDNEDQIDFSDVTFTDSRDSGAYTFQARAFVKDTDEPEQWSWHYSNAVTATVTGEPLALPTIGLRNLDDEGCVPRGQQLGVVFSNTPEGAASYHVRIYGDDEYHQEYFFQQYAAKNGRILLPTGNLQKNRNYRVEVWVEPTVGYDSVGTSGDEDDLVFCVVAGDASFTADKKTVWTQEDVTLNAYVPGAESLRIEVESDENGEEDSFETGGNNITWQWSNDHAGKWTFSLFQWQDDEWQSVTYVDDAGETQDITDIGVTVKSNGPLADPQIKSEDGNTLPSTLNAGIDMAFRVDTDDKCVGDCLSVEVFDEDDNYRRVKSWDNTAERTFTIPKEELEAGHTYRISAYTWADQYDSSDAEARILVVSVPEQTLPTLSMTVGGKSDASVEWPVNKEYEIAFEIDQTDPPVTADEIQIRWDDRWETVSINEGDNWYFDGDMTHGGVYTSMDDEVTRDLAIRARFGEDWVYSNSIKLNIVAEGTVPKPVVSVDGLSEDDTIARGQELAMTIGLPGKNGADDRNGVNQLTLIVYKDDDGERGYEEVNLCVPVSANATTATLNTAAFDEDTTYRVSVRVEPKEGWNGNESDEEDDIVFTVVEAEEVGEPTLTVSKSSVAIQERYTVSGFIPGVNKIALFRDGEAIQDWNGDSFSFEDGFWESGTHTYALGVYNAGNYRFVALAEPTVTVTVEPGDPLAKAVISSDNLVSDVDFSFTVSAVDHATEYSIGLRDKQWKVVSNPEGNWERNYQAREFDNTGKLTISLDKTVFEAYNDDDSFTICVTAAAPGYESSYVEKEVILTPAPGENITLNCAADNPTNLPVNKDVTFMLKCHEGFEKAQINTGDGWQDMKSYEGEEDYSFTYEWTCPYVVSRSVKARVSADDGGNWSYSNVVEVSFVSEGEIEGFSASISPSTLRKGDNLTVTINAKDRSLVDHFYVGIYGVNGDDFWKPYKEIDQINSDATSVVLSTGELQPGDYRVKVFATGKGGVSNVETDDNDSGLRFRLKAPLSEKATFSASANPVMVGETYSLIAYVPGANKLELYENGSNDPTVRADGETLEAYFQKDAAGEHTYRLKAYDDQDAQIEINCPDVTVTAHGWGDATYEWSDDNRTVTATRKCSAEDCTVESHTQTEKVDSECVNISATCTEPGTGTWTATFKNLAFAEQTKTDDNTPALGHDWGEATYDEWVQEGEDWKITASHTCTRCPETETETATATSEQTKAPTCTEPGVNTWTATFKNEGFEPQTRTDPIPVREHKWVKEDAVYEWSANHREVTATLKCHYDDCCETLTETVYAYASAVTTPATCDEAGKRDWTSDAFVEYPDYFEKQTTEETLKALGHDWNDPTYEWAEDYSTVTATRTCNNADHPETEKVNTSSNTKEPTYTEKGETTYTATFTNEAFVEQTKVVEIPVREKESEVIAAEEAIGKISTDAGLEDEAAVKAAREAYDKLTPKQKELLGSELENKLIAAEASVAAAKQDKADADAAQGVVDAINALGDNPTKEAVAAARAAFDALTDAQKAKVPADAVVKLTAAEDKAKDADAAQGVVDAINALGDNPTKEAVAAARAAYEALTEAQKAKVPADAVSKLTTAEAKVKAAEEAAQQEKADAEAARGVADIINALGDNPTKEAIEAARAAYDKLTDAQKAMIPADVLSRLTAAEEAARQIDIIDCEIIVKDVTFTGKAVTAKAMKKAVTVKYDGNKLTEGADYTFTYNKKAKAIGAYKLTVTGMGRYTGSVNTTFKVVPKGTAFSKLTGGDKQITLKWKSQKNITGYQIEYSLKKDFSGSKKVTVKKAKTLTTTIKKLKAGKAYYVRIRTYTTVKKKNYFSAWSKAKAVKTKASKAKNNFTVPNIEVTMNVGEKLELSPLVAPDASDNVLTWTTSDETIATVSQDGVVTALTPGEVVITATNGEGEQATAVVRVNEAEGVVLLDLGDNDLLLDVDDEFGEEIITVDGDSPVEIEEPAA